MNDRERRGGRGGGPLIHGWGLWVDGDDVLS